MYKEVESYSEKNNLAEFSNSTNFVHVVSWGGCAVLAKQEFFTDLFYKLVEIFILQTSRNLWK